MRKELEQRLVRRFPTWFKVDGNVHRLIPFEFQCGDGWFEIIWRLCVELEPLVTELEAETGERFEVVQVMQTLGTLRFYTTHRTDPIDELISDAREEAFHTCEVCASPGRWLETSGMHRVLCNKHGDGVQRAPGAQRDNE